MNIFSEWMRRISVLRILMILILNTVATALVKPYFGWDITFGYLWFRLLIVTVVMMAAYVLAGYIHARLPQPRLSRAKSQFLALVLGAVIGTIISGLLIGRTLTEMFTVEPMFWGMVFFVAVSIALGVLTATILVYREQAARAAADVARADAIRHELEKQVLAARLQLMQAQIEPHFLFNTLANVQHLVEANPPLAARTLESLITYLRAAMPQMREDSTTLGREATMARAYLDIQSVRMGPRLRYRVDVPEALSGHDFPPMMLLTLVENAIKHGIDPLQQGGEILVSGAVVHDRLEVSVSDNGQGLSHSAGMGVGLANIRERLQALYGKTAKLSLEENTPHGVVARLIIPHRSAHPESSV
jgi:sensor histidine kinase YesM